MRKHAAAPSCVEASWTMRSEAASLRLQNCGRLWFERTGEEGFTWSPARCRSRWCPSCSNLWREPVLEAFSAALPDNRRVTLVTLTGGRSVWPRELRGRVVALARALSRWRRRAKRDGVEGGLYAFEVTEAEETGKLHAHVHVTVIYRPEAWWAEADGRAVDASAKNGDTTAALAWLALTWSSALEREAPALYAELPLWCKAGGGGLLPSMERFRAHYFPEFGEVEARRGAVCDIGGRWPRPEKRGELLERLGSGEPREVLKETLKYTVKDGAELSTSAWCEVLSAFKGRRRVQAFGCLHGVRVNPEEAESVERSELTGRAAIVETGEPLGVIVLEEVLKAFVWRAEISRVEPERGGSLTWLECEIEGGS